MKKITEIAKVIRSKNSGPFELTLDIMFKKREYFDIIREKGLITKALISKMYGVPCGKIKDVVYFEPACAIKITMTRRIVSGSPGDSDVYGAQQHAPLLGLKFNI